MKIKACCFKERRKSILRMNKDKRKARMKAMRILRKVGKH
jgi:hypothetical protein